MTLHTVVVQTDDHICSSLGDEHVILDLSSGTYYGLDEIGARIWTLIGDACSVQQVCDQLAAEYDAQSSVIEQDVLRFLEELEEEGLVRRREAQSTQGA